MMLRLWVLAGAVLCALAGPVAAQAGNSVLDAAAQGDAETIRRLVAEKTPLEARDERGRTALLIATHRGDAALAEILIAAGADVNAMDALSDSPFLYAAAEGPIEILRMTLAAGADLRSTNRFGGTGLIPAAHHGHVEIVRELLTTRIPIDHINRLGWTALLEAIVLGDGGPRYVEIVHMLVAAGANVNLADSAGVRPLAHAERRGQTAISAILRNAGAN